MDEFIRVKPRRDLILWLEQHRAWSEETFGDGQRTTDLIKHIQKELKEIAECPNDVMEWIDLIILGFDGALRAGHSPEAVAQALWEKQNINSKRTWIKTSEDQPSEHIRYQDKPSEHLK
ncbi:MAG: dATP/dGTP pyrophosphohydrolase domain-containing protein [Nanoarchaeota archaeon]